MAIDRDRCVTESSNNFSKLWPGNVIESQWDGGVSYRKIVALATLSIKLYVNMCVEYSLYFVLSLKACPIKTSSQILYLTHSLRVWLPLVKCSPGHERVWGRNASTDRYDLDMLMKVSSIWGEAWTVIMNVLFFICAISKKLLSKLSFQYFPLKKLCCTLRFLPFAVVVVYLWPDKMPQDALGTCLTVMVSNHAAERFRLSSRKYVETTTKWNLGQNIIHELVLGLLLWLLYNCLLVSCR